jgi:hypothetical protein
MAVTYDFIYELMRAYNGGNLLVNKWLIGGKVEKFLDIENSVMQYIKMNGQVQRFQSIHFSVPFYLRKEKKIEEYLKKIEQNVFKNALLPITDEEIDNYNKYWRLDYIGYVFEINDNEDDIAIWRYKNKLMMFSLHRGKVLSDAFQIFFKPLAYKGDA